MRPVEPVHDASRAEWTRASQAAQVAGRIPSPVAVIDEADVTAGTDDDVVDDANADDLADLPEAARDLEVLPARGRIAARMIVDVLLPRALCCRPE